MNKKDIKKKVEAEKARYLPQAIKDEARSRARQEVFEALFPEREVMEKDSFPANAETKARAVGSSRGPSAVRIAANDPRLCGRQ